MSRDLGRDVLGSDKLYARKPWADFLLPSHELPVSTSKNDILDPWLGPHFDGHSDACISHRLDSGTKNQPKEEVLGREFPRTSGGHLRGYPSPKLRSGR